MVIPMTDLGHQRAYLRKAMKSIQRDFLDFDYAAERLEESRRKIKATLADALAYTAELTNEIEDGGSK